MQRWDQAQLRAWADLFKVDAFLDGSAGRGKMLLRESLTLAEATAHLVPGVVAAAATGEIDTLTPLLLARFAKVTHYLARVVARGGRMALFEEPTLTVGTIHSAKGGEADAVYLLPHLSPAADDAGDTDGIIRQRYVGMTRAKQSLTICYGPPRSWGSRPVEAGFLRLQQC